MRKNLGVQHPLGAKIWSPKKSIWVGCDFTSRSPQLVDQSSLDFFRLTRENRDKSNTCPISNIFTHSNDIRRRTSKSSKIGPNFACFWPLNFFWGWAPKNFGLTL